MDKGTIINLISELRPSDSISNPIKRPLMFNATVAWSLQKSFKKIGINCNYVHVNQILDKEYKIPKCTHTIVISGMATRRMRLNPWYAKKVRNSTEGKVCLYADADYKQLFGPFDLIFGVVESWSKNTSREPFDISPKYIHVGWGADPKYCFCRQNPDKQSVVFVNTLMYEYYGEECDRIYNKIQSVMDKLKHSVKFLYPVTKYSYSAKISWIRLQRMLRTSHFYICTQLGESGLTRIEAATCGALLVVAGHFWRERTMDSLSCRIWNSESELRRILLSNTNPNAIREQALKHSWNKVVKRIVTALNI